MTVHFLKIKNVNGLLEISRLVRVLSNNSNFGHPVIQRGKSEPADIMGAKKENHDVGLSRANLL